MAERPRVIAAEHANPARRPIVYCAGSTLDPGATSDDHGICLVCEQPFQLRSGKIPAHHA